MWKVGLIILVVNLKSASVYIIVRWCLSWVKDCLSFKFAFQTDIFRNEEVGTVNCSAAVWAPPSGFSVELQVQFFSKSWLLNAFFFVLNYPDKSRCFRVQRQLWGSPLLCCKCQLPGLAHKRHNGQFWETMLDMNPHICTLQYCYIMSFC